MTSHLTAALAGARASPAVRRAAHDLWARWVEWSELLRSTCITYGYPLPSVIQADPEMLAARIVCHCLLRE